MGNTKSSTTKVGIAPRQKQLESIFNEAKTPHVHEQWTLRDKDVEFLCLQTGLTPDEVTTWHAKFFHDNPDGRLDRNQFRKFYRLLRDESPERLDQICDHVFRAFDVDGNGFVEFGEFLLGFAISSRGNLQARLDYAFECYDLDSNGYLTVDEIEPVLEAMYTLMGIKHVKDYPPRVAAEDLMKKLDSSNDGRVTKDEFIYFLSKEGIYRNTVNPFN